MDWLERMSGGLTDGGDKKKTKKNTVVFHHCEMVAGLLGLGIKMNNSEVRVR